MKQKTITTDKATLLLMELPNGKYVRFHKGYIVQSCSTVLDLFNKCKRIDNGDTNGFIHIGNWQLLGRLPDITEDQKLKILSKHICDLCSLENKGVYGVNGGYVAGCEGSRCEDTREEIDIQFVELLEDNEVYFENPLKLDSQPSFFINEKGEYEKSSFHDDLEIYYQDRNWEEAQSKVWDKERCYLFIKQD